MPSWQTWKKGHLYWHRSWCFLWGRILNQPWQISLCFYPSDVIHTSSSARSMINWGLVFGGIKLFEIIIFGRELDSQGHVRMHRNVSKMQPDYYLITPLNWTTMTVASQTCRPRLRRKSQEAWLIFFYSVRTFHLSPGILVKDARQFASHLLGISISAPATFSSSRWSEQHKRVSFEKFRVPKVSP